MTHVPNQNDLTWKGLKLYFKGRKMLEIVQDERYASMFRVKSPDGTLSDMVNLTRARDAAEVRALRAVDPRKAITVSP